MYAEALHFISDDFAELFAKFQIPTLSDRRSDRNSGAVLVVNCTVTVGFVFQTEKSAYSIVHKIHYFGREVIADSIYTPFVTTVLTGNAESRRPIGKNDRGNTVYVMRGFSCRTRNGNGSVSDHGVFFFGHFQIVVGTVEPQCVGFRAPDGASACYRVGMDGNEKVGLGVVGYLCPSVQGYEDVLLSGIDDAYILAIVLDELAQLQRDVQVDVLFLPLAADGARVSASMTGVDDYGKVPSFRS